jgi:hypothetical protein
MAENKPNLVSIKLPIDLLNLMKDEQYAWRKAGRPEPTYAQLLWEAWAALKNTSSTGIVTQFKSLPRHVIADSVVELRVAEGRLSTVRALMESANGAVSSDEVPLDGEPVRPYEAVVGSAEQALDPPGESGGRNKRSSKKRA